MKKLFLMLLISLVLLTGCKINKKEETKKIVENNEMLSYTIDGKN